jgi:hypothetical protein
LIKNSFVKKFDGGSYHKEERYNVEHDHELTFSSGDPALTIDDFITRDVVLKGDLEVLHFRSLIIEVRMRLHPDNCNDDKPQSSLEDDMLKLKLFRPSSFEDGMVL